MNTVFALIALVGGVAVSLVGWQVVALDKFVSPGEAQSWHEKYDKIVKVLGPVAVVAGLLLLLF